MRIFMERLANVRKFVILTNQNVNQRKSYYYNEFFARINEKFDSLDFPVNKKNPNYFTLI